MEKRYVDEVRNYGGKSYRAEGALLINKILPEYNYDAKVYFGSENFRLSDYNLKKGGRLMVRNSGSNSPTDRNADRIVEDTKGILAFMKRQEKYGYKEFIVQRYPNEHYIKHAVSGSFVFEKRYTEVIAEIKKMPMEFLKLNMKTDTRNMGSRDFEPELEFTLSSQNKFQKKITGEFESSVNELSKIFQRMYRNFMYAYKGDVRDPTFLGVILIGGKVFPVDMKRKSHT